MVDPKSGQLPMVYGNLNLGYRDYRNEGVGGS